MKIGIVYDLREDYLADGYGELETAEFDRPDTIEAIESALVRLGHQTDRIGNVFSLIGRLVAKDRWDMVFNIAEGLRGFGREAQVPAILEAYDIPYTFSDPLVLTLTLHKGFAKRLARDLGVPTADFAVIEKEEESRLLDLPYPLFVKPVAEGTGKGITSRSKVDNPEELASACRRVLNEFGQPALVENFLPGREFTVGIVGSGKESRIIGIMEVMLLSGAEEAVYSYHNKEFCEELVAYRKVDDHEALMAGQTALDIWLGLGCRDAGRVDLRSDARGIPHFMEVNPLAGLHPEHSDLPILAGLSGTSFMELMSMIMESASKRVPVGNHVLDGSAGDS